VAYYVSDWRRTFIAMGKNPLDNVTHLSAVRSAMARLVKARPGAPLELGATLVRAKETSER